MTAIATKAQDRGATMQPVWGRTVLRNSPTFILMAVLGVMVIVPFLMLVFTSLVDVLPFSGEAEFNFTLSNYVALWAPALGHAIANTLVVSIGGTAIAMTIGCVLAWLAARTDIPFKPLVHLCGLMPLFISLVVASITWSLLAAGRTGYLNIIFDSMGLPFHINVQSLFGITFVHGLYYVPYPYIFVYSALTLVHPDLEEAAAVHGGSLSQSLRRVTFPLVKPAIVGAMLLVLVSTAEEFPVPSILGGPVGIETLSIRIYELATRVPGDPNQASAVSILLTAIVCMLVYTQRKILRGRDYRTLTGKGIQVRPIRLRWLKWIAVAFVGLYGFVALGLPILALIQGSIRGSLYIPNVAAFFDPKQLSLEHLIEAINSEEVHTGLINSFSAGILTAIFGGTLYFALAYVVNRTELKGRQILEYMSMVPLALPALVMGLGILWTWVSVPLPIYGTLAILVIAFATRFMPQGYRAVSSSISQIHDDLEEAAMIAGASRVQAVRRITLPLLRGAIVSTMFLMVVLSMRELTASLFLYTSNTRVLSIVIFEAYENGFWTSVASISLIYTTILVILTLVGRRWMRADL
jgi:iron(III) transport system permease protein